MKNRKVFALVLLGMSCLLPTSSYADDELYLCGIVRQIDIANGTAVIDVTSENCPGSREFKTTANADLSPNDVDVRKCFFIDSDSCKSGYVYTITKTESE